jgi:exoribonuclease R
MLPTILSDSLCSLEQGQPRFGFRLSLEIKDNQILENTIQFKNVEIRVQHNYVYESMDLLRNPFYQTFLNATQQLDSKIQDSHDVVAFWMIYMNQTVGTKLATKAMGIFRQAALTNPDAYEKTLREMPEELGQDTKRTISNWNHTTGNYVTISKSTSNQPTLLPRHEIMQTHSYIHITSPIRRLVDLLNQMIFSAEYSVVQCLSRDAQDFVQQWITDLDYINTTMRSIRKVQIDCDVLKECYAHPEWMQQRHPGIAFDQVQKTDGTFSCMVYLEHLKILSRINTSFVVENYSRHYFRLFVFEDEHKIKNKIRLELCVG